MQCMPDILALCNVELKAIGVAITRNKSFSAYAAPVQCIGTVLDV